MRKIALTGLAALAMMLGGVAHASAAVNPAPARTSSASTTSAVSTPAAATANTSISGSRVSCGSVKFCLSVSQNIDSAGNSVPAADAWNGTAWKPLAVTLPRGASGALNGVSCKQASCLVIGNYSTKTGNYLFALRWNGRTLTRVAAPPKPAGASDTTLGDVSCVTASSCVVIGSVTTAAGTTRAVVDTWNGVKWTMRTAALPASVLEAEFAGLSCVSASHCVAGGLGLWGSIASSSFTPGPLLASWNGSTVTTAKAPAPKGAGFQMITDVSCVSATSCAATGFGGSTSGATTYGFTDVLAGKAWKMAAVAWPRGSASTGLLGVSCPSARSCVAVGADGMAASSTGDTGNAAALSYNGTTWTLQKNVPGPGRGNASMFGGVSCVTATYCVASGLTGKAGGNAAVPLTGVWNGKSWKLFRLP
jgi:hypothetical protein